MKSPAITTTTTRVHALSVVFSAALLWLASAALFAQDERFVAGVHYQILHQAQPTQSGEKIEVVEMFWYECPHCYRLEPFISRWLQTKPQHVAFVPVPAILNRSWEFDARMYYTMQALGIDEALHTEVFKAIHEVRRPLRTLEQFADWAAEHGADRATLLAAFDSFAVQNKINFAMLMSRKYGISGVPAIIVDGRYRTSVSLAGGQAKLIEVINHLVTLAAEQRSG